mgnify:CR=1 FL=1
MKTAVVILNWNGKKFLEQFLPTVIKYSSDAAVFVADNGSSDDSVSFLEKTFPLINILHSSSNKGFAGGYNEALKQIEAEYFILLNSDVEVTENWINPVIDLMDLDKTIAACQPKIRMHADKKMFEYAGAAGGFIDKYGYPFCRGRIFDSLEEDKGQYNDNCEVFWATGACMFLRSAVFFDSGGFDEDFFAHMEEIDLCWRIWNAGYTIVYFPKSEIFHIGGGTLPKNSSYKTFLNFRNSLYLFHKNYPGNDLPFKFLKRLIMDGLAGIKFLVQGYPLDTFAIVRAHFAYCRSIPILHRKRIQLKHNSHKMLMKYSIVWGYFIKGKKKYNDY